MSNTKENVCVCEREREREREVLTQYRLWLPLVDGVFGVSVSLYVFLYVWFGEKLAVNEWMKSLTRETNKGTPIYNNDATKFGQFESFD